jgi:hexulose-6-phosphate isomerase
MVGESGAPSEGAAKHLRWLVSRADLLGARYIVLPFVDSSSIRTGEGIRTLTGMLSTFIPYLEEVGVELHLETDLLPEILGGVLGSINHPLIRANYDSGNSAALGYAPGYELGLIGKWVSSVHVKDRLLGGGSVPLGTGAADFPACFAMLRNSGFHGLYILQAARDPTMSELDLAIRNRGFVERYLMNR